MKISQQELRQIIKEETHKALNEYSSRLARRRRKEREMHLAKDPAYMKRRLPVSKKVEFVKRLCFRRPNDAVRTDPVEDYTQWLLKHAPLISVSPFWSDADKYRHLRNRAKNDILHYIEVAEEAMPKAFGADGLYNTSKCRENVLKSV